MPGPGARGGQSQPQVVQLIENITIRRHGDPIVVLHVVNLYRAWFRCRWAIHKRHQRHYIIRAARLNAWPNTAFAHPAKRLAQYDRPSGGSIDIKIAGANPLAPALVLPVVEAFQAGS